MRTIIVFNDNTPAAENAAEFALDIAQKVQGNILILNLNGVVYYEPVVRQLLATNQKNANEDLYPVFTMADHLYGLVTNDEFRPSIDDIDASEWREQDIARLIIRENVWMMVKGVAAQPEIYDTLTRVSTQSVLNRVACPLLLIPENYRHHSFTNIAYMADMRYCMQGIVKYLATLAAAYDANLVVEHLSMRGLPPLDDGYALTMFSEDIADKIKYDKIYFNNIKERNLDIAIDVMVNNMHTDLLAMVNHNFHFEEMFGRYITEVFPEHIPVPAIIFPS
ncbi:MAG TPA: hypothetical protein VHC47_12565 [Mucilaginibacter sp.]|nr:hypothetical protein [Mucilaginibacter sp.]